MSDKYYTPDISEFHVGFEYEYREDDKPFTTFNEVASDLEVDPIDKIREDIKNNLIRVKYLDREDIEECGWEWKGSTKVYDLYYDKETEKHSVLYSEQLKRILITLFSCKDNIHETVFIGTMKNKSELKRILKQVGITK